LSYLRISVRFVDVTGVGSAVAVLSAAVDGLLSLDLTRVASVELTEVLAGVERERRRLEAVDVRLVGEVDQRAVAGEYARTSTADLLVSLLRIGRGEARARVNRSIDLGPRRPVSGGELLQPTFPLVAAALTAGDISATHAEVITDCLDRIPAVLAPGAAPVAEQLLVDTARHCEPAALARTGRDLLTRLDPDGIAPTDRDHQRRRGWTLAERRDGTGRLSGELTPEAVAVWRTVVDALSVPAPVRLSDSADAGGAGGPGERDDRSPAQRRHDGFLDAGRRLLRSGTLPESGGVPLTVLVTVDASQLAARTGHGRTGHGEPISIPALLTAAVEADIVPVVLNDTGAVLAYGRTRRIATANQRRALAARDGGCAFPGCTRPPAWCEAHHVIPWADGGPTDLDNLVLLCGWHHREFAARGWVITRTDGVPHFLPPPWLDPHQTPQRNTAHHPTDITFDAPTEAVPA
jgi:Domain of unknown function (DUF222)/HNH endonuclease